MKYHHVIFDLDGTLFDTESALLHAWRETLREDGYDLSLEDFDRLQGNPMTVILNDILKVSVSADFEDRWIQSYAKYAEDVTYFPGMEYMLDTLLQKGCHLGVITSRDQEEFNAFYSRFHMEDRFGVIILANNTPYHKPEPGVLYYYAEKAKAELSDCLFVGDMFPDIQTGINAGVDTGLVKWSDSRVEVPGATYTFHSPDELLALFE